MGKPFPYYPITPQLTSHGDTASVTIDENVTFVTTIPYSPVNAVLSLSGPDAALFNINISDDQIAQLVFLTAPDYENPGDAGTNNVYNVTVTATLGSRTDSCAFSVTVANISEGTPGGDVTAPTLLTATVNAAGTTLTIVWSENVTNSSGLILTATNGSAGLTYATGSGTSTYTYTIHRPILAVETVTIGASSSNIVDGATNTLADFTGHAVVNSSTQIAGVGTSLRPTIFPSIPSEPTSAGYLQNDLSTSVRTDVIPTTRGAVVTIAAGTYTSPYTASTANRTIRLLGNVTFDGAGIIINAANVTVDLNSYTLTYMNVDLEEEQVGTIISSGTGTGGRPTIVCSGVSNSGLVIQFLTGAEANNWYEVYSGSAPNLTLDNATLSTDTSSDIQRWNSGGPAPGDTFRIFDPRKTFGIGTLPSVYNKNGVEIVNGYIVQGAAASLGSGYNAIYNTGCSPICCIQGQSNWLIGGVKVTWSSRNTGGIWNRFSGPVEIKYCEIHDQGTFVSNRQRGCPSVFVNASSNVHHNRLINHRHTGIECNGDNCVVQYNEIYGDSRATNAYGVGCYQTEGHTWRYNNIYKVGEHPMCIAIHSDGCQNNNIYGNWCEAKTTRSSTEYPWNYATALSNRWGVRTLANNVYDNCFITYSQDGPGIQEISRGKTIFFGVLNNSSGENLHDNFIGAYNTDGTTECHAIGLSEHNSSIVFRDNVIAGTHNLIWIGDNYGQGMSGGRFIDNEMVKVGSDPSFKTFMCNGYYNSNADFISNTYGTGTGNAASDIGEDDQSFGAPDSGNIFRFGFNLTVTVTSGGSPVSGATITIKDAGNNTLRSGYVTNGSGVVVIDVPTFYRQGGAFGSTSLNALTVSAVSSALTGSNTISPTSDDSITVTIS